MDIEEETILSDKSMIQSQINLYRHQSSFKTSTDMTPSSYMMGGGGGFEEHVMEMKSGILEEPPTKMMHDYNNNTLKTPIFFGEHNQKFNFRDATPTQ